METAQWNPTGSIDTPYPRLGSLRGYSLFDQFEKEISEWP